MEATIERNKEYAASLLDAESAEEDECMVCIKKFEFYVGSI